MIHHIAIFTERPEELASFYESLPGMKSIRVQNDETGRLRSVWMESGGSPPILMIERGLRTAPGALVFSLFRGVQQETGSVTANQEVTASIHDLSLFLPLVEKKSPFTLYFRDPDGNLLGYSSYPQPLSDFGL